MIINKRNDHIWARECQECGRFLCALGIKGYTHWMESFEMNGSVKKMSVNESGIGFAL